MRKPHKGPKRQAGQEAGPPDAIVGKHKRQLLVGGGRSIASISIALGIGLSLLGMIATGSLRRSIERTPKVVCGTKDEVYFSNGATREHATSLCRTLHDLGFFVDRGAKIRLSKDEGGAVISFVVAEGVWDLPDAVLSFEDTGREVAGAVGGFPIKLRLLDTAQTVRRELVVGKAIIGALDEIYYYGSATQADAFALGQALRTAGFLKDKGASVVLNKGYGTAVSFVVNADAWEQPDVVADFARVTRSAAASVGGPPIKLRLVNSHMATRFEMVVQ